MSTINGTSGNDALAGIGEGDFFVGTNGNDTLTGFVVSSGVGGAKTQNVVDYAALTGGVSLNLTTGIVDKGVNGVDSMSNIAQVYGTSFGDYLSGDSDRNWYLGRAGNDTLDGLSVGDDNDRAIYTTDPGGIIADLGAGTIRDGYGGVDTVIEIEHVHGSLFDDFIRGDQESNVLVGLKGSDTLDGGGTGSLVGLINFDTVDYRFEAFASETGHRGVSVDLAAGTAIDPYGNTDTLLNIEAITGSRFVDTVVGNASDNSLIGMQGADVLDGGGGTDQISFFRDEAGVRVDVSAGFAIDGWGYKDAIANFEWVQGSDFSDTVFGGGIAFVDGGSGTDALVLSESSSAYTVTLTGAGSGVMSGASDAVGSFLGVEKLFFTDGVLDATTGVFDTTLAGTAPKDSTGTEAAESLFGASGDDYVFAKGGNDQVVGGSGSDVLYGNTGSDVLYGNANDDRLFGGQDADVLFGGQHVDVLYGNFGADVLYGNLGEDILYGGQGDDTLFGGQGNDHLFGNVGNDILRGNLGADTFYRSAGSDQVADFSLAQGDKVSGNGSSYTSLADVNDSAVFTFADGSTVTLIGVSADQANAAFFV